MCVISKTDPFYSENNLRYLEGVIRDIESGKSQLVEHDLIEPSCCGNNSTRREVRAE